MPRAAPRNRSTAGAVLRVLHHLRKTSLTREREAWIAEYAVVEENREDDHDGIDRQQRSPFAVELRTLIV